MIERVRLPDLRCARPVGDYWELARANVPPELFDSASWERLRAAAAVLPGPAFLLERTLDAPRIIQFGCHIWPWRMAAVLAAESGHPHAAFLAAHVRAWRPADPYLHLMAMWDEPVADAPPPPQVFLAFTPDAPGWRAAVAAFADRLDAADVAAAWRRCADAPHGNVTALGVYRGRRDLPTRVTRIASGPRDWPDHPNWPAVDAIAALTEVRPAVAVAPSSDPGPTWHVPVIASRHPRPHTALAPLVDALRARGLVDADTARVLARPPQMIPVPWGATLDGEPALLRLMLSLERLKVVVERGEWVSAKACYGVRLVWRTASGRVVVED